jgi:hypothetical protein
MFDIYKIYLIKKIKEPLIFNSFIFIVCFITTSLFVSISNVITNTPLEFKSFFTFYIVAFKNTEFVVKIVLILFIYTTFTTIKNFVPILNRFKLS